MPALSPSRKGLKILRPQRNGKRKIFVAPDGVDLEKFTINLNKEECRERFSLPQNKKIIMYTGHLYDWKGSDILLEAAREFES